MEYERIHKVQTGIISPSKLRMKLIGPHHQKKKDGSNSNSSRTSPSKVEDTDFVKNSLLTAKNEDFDEEAPSLDISSVKLSGEAASDLAQGVEDQVSSPSNDSLPRGNGDKGPAKMQQFSKGDGGNMSTIHPVRNLEDENLDYDSNASSSSFEFHKGERSMHNPMRGFSRPMPSKWNNAEKWIMNRHNAQFNYSKKAAIQGQTNRLPVTNTVRVAPESANYDHKLVVNRVAETKRVDFCQPAVQMGVEKFSFVPPSMHPILCQANGLNTLSEPCVSKDLKEVEHMELSCSRAPSEDASALPAIRAVSMRDMGTEMTPIASQEPSRTSTPIGATTPFRSPTSSNPSTPRKGAPASTPMEYSTHDESQLPTESSKKQLSEHELKEKTRKEIVALGVQLGKMNIAAWASKDEQEKNTSETISTDELERIENEKHAAAWEEAEKSKHYARCKREEIRIQAWESQQKVKLEAEMRRVEARVEQMRAQAHAKMVQKIAMARQKSEEKRAAAEAKRNQQAERTAAQAEYIRQTGRIPSSNLICCGWW